MNPLPQLLAVVEAARALIHVVAEFSAHGDMPCVVVSKADDLKDTLSQLPATLATGEWVLCPASLVKEAAYLLDGSGGLAMTAHSAAGKGVGVSDDEKWYCAVCLCPVDLSEDMDCEKCCRPLIEECDTVGHATMLRRKADAEREFNKAKAEGLFR